MPLSKDLHRAYNCIIGDWKCALNGFSPCIFRVLMKLSCDALEHPLFIQSFKFSKCIIYLWTVEFRDSDNFYLNGGDRNFLSGTLDSDLYIGTLKMRSVANFFVNNELTRGTDYDGWLQFAKRTHKMSSHDERP